MTGSVPKRRSRWVYLLYLLSALAVVAGGVFAGFKIREIRLDRGILTAERRALVETRDDLYNGYLQAEGEYTEIVGVRANQRTRAQLARIQAAIAAEFGAGYDKARARVGDVVRVQNADAAVARALYALAQDDLAKARKRAREVAERYPTEVSGPYLSGKVALLEGRAADAVALFKEASERDPRPAVYVSLGLAHLAGSSFAEAKAAFQLALKRVPEHPAAIIGLARLAAAAGTPAAGDDGPEAQLDRLIDRGTDEPTAPSPWQRAWASLTMVSLALARGDQEGVEEALLRARQLRPERDLRFAKAFIAILLAVGDVDGAKSEAGRAAKQWPDRLDVRIFLARVGLAHGEPAQVIEVLEGELGGNVEALVLRGRGFLLLGEIDKAMADLDAAITKAPKNASALLGRVELHLASRDFAGALERLKPIVEPDVLKAIPAEQRIDLQVAYAAALRGTGARKQAREILSQAVSLPRAGRAHLELARLAKDEGKHKQAQKSYAEAVRLLPESTEVALEAALSLLDIGAIGSARQSLDELSREHSSNLSVLIEAARVQILTGAHEEAKQSLDSAEKLAAGKGAGPDGSLAWRIERERGRLALKEYSPAEAIGRLEKARESGVVDVDTYWLLAHALYEAGKDRELREVVADVLKLFPKEAPIRELAMARREMYFDRLAEAQKFFQKGLEKLQRQKASPRMAAAALYWIGRVHMLANRMLQAEKSLRRAIRLDSGNAAAYYYLGRVLIDRGRTQGAAGAFEKSLSIDVRGVYPDVWYDLGEARFNLRRLKGARDAFEKYLKIWPKGDYREDARAYLRRLPK